jgi:rare lipoprotein A
MTEARTLLRATALTLLIICLSACSSTKRGGGYYKDDGPDANPPSNLDAVPDAVPKLEPFASGPNKPYAALGKNYTPDKTGGAYRAQGLASWYGKKFHGNPTSTGERYDMYAMTAAHTTLPIPSYVRVTRVATGKTVVVRVNDRGPFHDNRIIDLSYVAAHKLGVLKPGSAEVIVERIMPDEIRNWNAAATQVATAQIAQTSPVMDAPPLPQANQVNISDNKPISTLQSEPPASNTMVKSTNTSSKLTPPGSMFLQVGAFSDPAKAQTIATQVSGQIASNLGHPVFVEQTPNNLYRVRIGPFTNRDAATQAVSPIQAATGMTPSLSAP